jgi:hypothetical protein
VAPSIGPFSKLATKPTKPIIVTINYVHNWIANSKFLVLLGS